MVGKAAFVGSAGVGLRGSALLGHRDVASVLAPLAFRNAYRAARPLGSVAMTAAGSSFDYDLFVIGAGSGGVRASRISAGHGAKVAVAENKYLGGTCVNVGCVPKKLYVYGSHYRHDMEDASAYGWNMDQTQPVDWPRLEANKDAEITRLNGIYRRMLGNAGVEILEGTAKLTGPNSVQIGDKTYTSDKILIAVGGTPIRPSIPGSEHAVTSDEIFKMNRLPERIVIVGGGYIGVEFAGIFNGYGSKVSQIIRGGQILRGFDVETAAFVQEQMTTAGVDFRVGTTITSIEKDDAGVLHIALNDGSTIDADHILFATGREPLTKGLGLESVGVELGKKGEIVVDKFSQTNIDNIYAVGDVTDRVNLTPVALAEGHCFADTVFANRPRSPVYDDIPTAVFSQPAIGTCGLTEEEARAKYGDEGIAVYKSSFRPMKHTLTKREERTFLKLIVEKESDRVVGCHMAEPNAGDVIQLVGVAMKAGATKADFDSTIGVHPTSAEELVTMRTPSN